MEVKLTISVKVIDEDALRAYAIGRYTESWGLPPEDENMGLPTLVLEALVLSNENPSPDLYGIEILDYTAKVV